MMPEQGLTDEKRPAEKAFPWRCPKCLLPTVNRVTMPYRCQRTYEGRAVMVEVPNLVVPRCSNCGKVVFDYAADEQIRVAFQTQFIPTRVTMSEGQMEEQPEKVQNHLPAMREDYKRVTGVPFNHFFCPLLLRDEDTRLCMGHIVNQKIANSCRKSIVQRHDIDSWYSKVVERDFINLNALRRSAIEDVLLKKELRTKIKPRFTTAEGKECDHYPE